MPTHCMDCPFMVIRDNDDCILQSDEANENFENWEQMKAGCPLIELPPHGDLIDRAELLQHKGNCYDENDHLLYAVGTGIILKAPTILPAEGEPE